MKVGKPNRRVEVAAPTTSCTLYITALTPVLVPVQALSAYANQNAQETRTEEAIFNPEESSSASVDSKVTGHVRVELASAVMPVDGLEFQVDTETLLQINNPGAQIQSPGIQIRDLPVVPVKLGIFQVAEIKDEDVKFSEKLFDQVEQSFQLVGRISSVGASGTATLILEEENRRYDETSFKKDAIMPGKKDIFTTGIPAEEAGTLKLCGKVAPDLYGGYQLIIRPTLKISAAQADPSDRGRSTRKQR